MDIQDCSNTGSHMELYSGGGGVRGSFYISGFREQSTYKWWCVGDKQSLWVTAESHPLAGRRQPQRLPVTSQRECRSSCSVLLMPQCGKVNSNNSKDSAVLLQLISQ